MDPIKNIIENVFKELQNPEVVQRRKVFEKWHEIAGKKISEHTKPSLTKEGKLYIWVDQAALAFELKQKYQSVLLKRIQAAVGEGVVKEIYFRVGQLR